MIIIKSIAVLIQVILIIIFMGILSYGVFQLWTEFYLRAQCPTVEGTVTDVYPVLKSSSEKSTLRSWGANPELSYPRGNLYRILVKVNKPNSNDSFNLLSEFPGLGLQKKGDPFPVLYNQAFPNQSRIRHSWGMLLVPILAVVLGAICLFLVIGLFFWFEIFDTEKPDSLYLFRSWNQWLLTGSFCAVVLLFVQLPRVFPWMDFDIVQALVTGEMRLLPVIVAKKYPPAEGELLSLEELSILSTPILKLAYIETVIPWFFRRRRYADLIRYFKAREQGLISFEPNSQFLKRMGIEASELNSQWLRKKYEHKL